MQCAFCFLFCFVSEGRGVCVCACGWLGTWDWCVGDDDDGMIESYGLLVASGGVETLLE